MIRGAWHSTTWPVLAQDEWTPRHVMYAPFWQVDWTWSMSAGLALFRIYPLSHINMFIKAPHCQPLLPYSNNRKPRQTHVFHCTTVRPLSYDWLLPRSLQNTNEDNTGVIHACLAQSYLRVSPSKIYCSQRTHSAREEGRGLFDIEASRLQESLLNKGVSRAQAGGIFPYLSLYCAVTDPHKWLVRFP